MTPPARLLLAAALLLHLSACQGGTTCEAKNVTYDGVSVQSPFAQATIVSVGRNLTVVPDDPPPPGGCVAALSMRHGPCGDFAEYSTAPELYVTAECTSANGGSWAGFEILLPDIRTLGPGTYPIGVSSSGGLSTLNGTLTVEKLTCGAAAYPDIVTGDFDSWFRLDVSGPGDAGKLFEARIIFDLKAAQIHAYPATTCTVYAC